MAHKRKTLSTSTSSREFELQELPNGLRVVYKHVPHTRAVHCGFVIDIGSRDDPADAEGMAHFIEHALFKGTTRRKTYHILNYLESVGGDINAYTGKEKTSIYASLAAEHADRAVNILTDIIFNSTFPEKEINKERQVISEEIDLYRDVPDEAIFEDFDLMVFPEHPLGKPILGSKDSIKKIDQAKLKAFVQNHYSHDNLIFSIVGNVTENKANRLIDKYLRPLKLESNKLDRTEPTVWKPQQIELKTTGRQAHEIIGGRAPALQKGPYYYTFLLLNNLLGGPAMNARLNFQIREKHGLTYSINSFISPFLDSGMWGVYYACEPDALPRVRRMVYKLLKDLRDKPLGNMSLHQAKKQFIGQITLASENILGQMLGISKDLLDFGESMSFAEHIKKLEAITASDIQAAAQFYMDEMKLGRLTYLPDSGQ